MGFKLRRKKSSPQPAAAALGSARGGTDDHFPAHASLDNTTISTKQTASSSRRGFFGGSPGSFHPQFVDEGEAVTSLPPLGLSLPELGGEGSFFGAVFDSGDAQGFEEARDVQGSNRGSPGNVESPGSPGGSSMFEGLSRAWTPSPRESPGASLSNRNLQPPGTPTRRARDPKAAPSSNLTALPPSSLDRKTSRRGRQAEPRGTAGRRDPPEQASSATTGKGRRSLVQDDSKKLRISARNLRDAMRHEISKHRDREPSPIFTQPGDPMTRRSQWPRPSDGTKSQLPQSANSKRSNAVLAAAGVAVTGAGAVVARRSSKRWGRKRSASGESDDSSGEFPDQGSLMDEESAMDQSAVDAGSFWSFGALGNGGDDEDMTRESGSYEYDEDGTEGTYDDEESLESYADEASYASYQSNEAGGRSVAQWFGFGGGQDDATRDATQGTDSVDYSRSSGGSSQASEAKGGGNSAEEEAHDCEGRPMVPVTAVAAVTTAGAAAAAASGAGGEDLATPQALVKRPSFRDKLKSLKPPLSPGGSISKRSARGENDAASTAGSAKSTKSKGSVRSKGSWRSAASGATAKSAGSAASRKSAASKKQQWDDDVRQRDVYCAKCGDAENLTVRQYSDVPMPRESDHVLVKIEASTVSSKDCYVRLMGELGQRPEPAVPGFHIVGTVHSLGAKVHAETLQEGDRVAALLPNGGGNAKYVSIPSEMAVLLPHTAEHEDIICLVANYMTAYQCLKLAKKDGAPLTNENVLITGGSGPVGQALVELAVREGANVYATAHKMHEEHLTKLGAKWFSVKPNKWLPQLEGKMDAVIDSLCVDGYESSYRALAPDGILVCNTGNSNSLLRLQNDPAFCHAFDDNGLRTWWSGMKARFLWSNAVFYDLNESFEANPRLFEQELHYLICKLQLGEISPKVAGRVSLNQVPKAQKLIEKGLPNGTVVCLPWKKLDSKQKVKVEKKTNY